MQTRLTRLSLATALFIALLALVNVGTADGSEERAAWCYSYGEWLGYAEDVPGSVTQEQFLDCLRAAVKTEDARVIRGQLVPEGVLLDFGEKSILWMVADGQVTDATIVVKSDWLLLFDSCGTKFASSYDSIGLNSGTLACFQERHMVLEDRDVERPHFLIYIHGPQVLVHGYDIWHHLQEDQAGWDGSRSELNRVNLKSDGESVWIDVGSYSYFGWDMVFGHEMYVPLASRTNDGQHVLSAIWEDHIYYPLSVNHAWSSLYNDWDGSSYIEASWDAYTAQAQEWIDAMLYDLFGDRAEPIALRFPDAKLPPTPVEPERIIDASTYGTQALLREFGRILVGLRDGSNGTLAATQLMLWERYLPEFDKPKALAIAQSLGVQLEEPIEVLPVSERTDVVKSLLSKPPPDLPSDTTPVPPGQLRSRLMLEIGKQYPRDGDEANALIIDLESLPGCGDNPDAEMQSLTAKFSINALGSWNGIGLSRFRWIEPDGRTGFFMYGKPRTPGRVLVELTAGCRDYPGPVFDRGQGYGEVLVRESAGGG